MARGKKPSSIRGIAGLVSVIIATRDRPHQLSRLLTTVRAQSYPRIETIIVNDSASTDISRLAKNHSINTIIRTNEVGQAAAENKGFLRSSGEFVIFPDDDMELKPTMIAKLARVLTRHPSKAYAYCGFQQVEGNKLETLGLVEFDPKRLVLFGNYISMASLIRREKFVEVGMFDPSSRRLHDWDLWLSFLERDDEGVLVPEILFNHVYLGGPRISSEDNPRSFPSVVATRLVERKHSELIERFLKTSDPLSMLLELYWSRKDLQDAFPEVRDGKYHRLMGWSTSTSERTAALEHIRARYFSQTEIDPMFALLGLYYGRPELRQVFPEVERGDYVRLLKWASSSTQTTKLLAPHMLWYRDNQITQSRDLEAMRNELQTKTRAEEEFKRITADRESVIQHLRADNAKLSGEFRKIEQQLDQTMNEIEVIRSSFGFRFMRFYGSRIDRLLPDGTRRGRIRKHFGKSNGER